METMTLKTLLAEIQASPEDALTLAVQATEIVQAEAERARADAKAMAEVSAGPDGYAVKNLGGLYRLGQMYAASKLVSEQYQNNPADCAIVCQLAQRWRIDPFMALQHVYVVHGRPAVDSQLATSLLHNSGKIKGTVQYRFSGEPGTLEYGCEASVVDAHTGETVTGPRVDWKIVKAEKWDATRKGFPSKWSTIPDLMFHYRAAMWLIRTRYPEVVLGLLSIEEAEELPEVEPLAVLEPVALKKPTTLGEVTERLAAQADGSPVTVQGQPIQTNGGTVGAELHPEESTEDPPEVQTRDVMAEAQDYIERCGLIREVRAALDEYLAMPLPDATKTAINAMAERRIGEVQEENRQKRLARQAKEKQEADEAAAKTPPVDETAPPAAPVQQGTTPPAAQKPAAAVAVNLQLDKLLRAAKEATSARSITMVRTAASQQVSEGKLAPVHYTEVLAACDQRADEMSEERRAAGQDPNTLLN